MDYIKFAGASWLGFVAATVALDMGSPLSFLIVLVGITWAIAKYRPKAHTIGFVIWALLIATMALVVWHGSQDLQISHPEKWTAEHAANLRGFANVLTGILLQPLCYWLGRVGVKLTHRSSEIVPEKS